MAAQKKLVLKKLENLLGSPDQARRAVALHGADQAVAVEGLKARARAAIPTSCDPSIPAAPARALRGMTEVREDVTVSTASGPRQKAALPHGHRPARERNVFERTGYPWDPELVAVGLEYARLTETLTAAGLAQSSLTGGGGGAGKALDRTDRMIMMAQRLRSMHERAGSCRHLLDKFLVAERSIEELAGPYEPSEKKRKCDDMHGRIVAALATVA